MVAGMRRERFDSTTSDDAKGGRVYGSGHVLSMVFGIQPSVLVGFVTREDAMIGSSAGVSFSKTQLASGGDGLFARFCALVMGGFQHGHLVLEDRVDDSGLLPEATWELQSALSRPYVISPAGKGGEDDDESAAALGEFPNSVSVAVLCTYIHWVRRKQEDRRQDHVPLLIAGEAKTRFLKAQNHLANTGDLAQATTRLDDALVAAMTSRGVGAVHLQVLAADVRLLALAVSRVKESATILAYSDKIANSGKLNIAECESAFEDAVRLGEIPDPTHICAKTPSERGIAVLLVQPEHVLLAATLGGFICDSAVAGMRGMTTEQYCRMPDRATLEAALRHMGAEDPYQQNCATRLKDTSRQSEGQSPPWTVGVRSCPEIVRDCPA